MLKIRKVDKIWEWKVWISWVEQIRLVRGLSDGLIRKKYCMINITASPETPPLVCSLPLQNHDWSIVMIVIMWLLPCIPILLLPMLRAKVNTEAGLLPVFFGELDAQPEPSLPRFLPHQKLLLVRLHLNYISFVKLKSCLHSVVLIVGVAKCLAFVLQKETPVADLFGVIQIKVIPFNHFPHSQTETLFD